MIHEFALDPEAVTSWADKPTQKLILEVFRPGSGRVPACLPSNWRQAVLATMSGGDQNRLKELEIFARALLDRKSKRQATDSWDRKARTWLENAIAEHNAYPFHAIVTPNSVNDCPQAVGVDVDLDAAPWSVRRSMAIPRDGRSLATALAPMLFSARSIILLDPVFRPELRFFNPIDRLLSAAASASFTTTVDILIREKDTDKPWLDMSGDCERLTRFIPPKVILNITYVPESSIPHRLHNRFVLTESAGVMLGDSIDEGDPGQTNDIALLDDGHFMQVLSDARQILAGERTQRRTLRCSR